MEYILKNKLCGNSRNFIKDSLDSSLNIKNLVFSDDKIIIDLSDEIEDKTLTQLIKKLIYISGSIDKDILYENSPEHKYSENPMKYLISRKNIKKIAAGMFMYQGDFLKIFNSSHDFVKNLAKEYNAVEQEFPVFWTMDMYKKINYFKDFPQQVILATTVKNDFSSKENFSREYSSENKYSSISVDKYINPCEYGLQPAVCDTCYYLLSNEKNYKNTIYTTYNKVFRNEYSKSDSLDRLKNFSVRDIMFVGDKEFVLSIRQKMIDEAVKFLEYFNIEGKIETANDPFFGNESTLKNIYQYAFKLKYEITAKINHDNSSLAIGSINLHQDVFGKAFNILLEDGSYAYSGCIGFGFERIVYALYCQYGHNIIDWPEGLRKKLCI